CLAGNTPICMSLGKVNIKELVNNYSSINLYSSTWKKELPVNPTDIKVVLQGIKESQVISSDLSSPERIQARRITTKMGRVIEATLDHPFYSEKGKVPASSLSLGDRVAVYPIDLPERESNIGRVVLTPEEILDACPPNTYTNKVLKELNESKLLNIPPNSTIQINLAALVGHLISDGTLWWDKRGVHVTFRVSSEEDAEAIQNALRSIGIEPPEPRTKVSRGDEILTFSGKILRPIGKAIIIDIRKRSYAILFNALGVPVGDKVTQEFSVPDWILNGSKMVKRAFLRAYFGGELSSPRLHTSSNKIINQPVFKMSKIDGLSAIPFFNDIKILLSEFGADISSISTELGNIRKKDGYRTTAYVANISSNEQQLLSFYKKIGYEFAKEKEIQARYISEYLTFKLSKRTEMQKIKAEAIQSRIKGQTLEQIAERFNTSPTTISRWERGVYENAGLPIDFPSYSDWQNKTCEKLNDGLVWDSIVSIEDLSLDVVYDVSMDSPYDNFVANEFLTGNCPPYNADFDGDEMNLHVPQSEEARTEAELLLKVQEHILSPRFGGPILGGIQDFISHVFQFTSKDSIYNLKDTMKLLYNGGVFRDNPDFKFEDMTPIVTDPEPMYSGKQIFSALFPDDLNIRVRSKFCKKCYLKENGKCKELECEYDAYVNIKNGELITGTIDENSFGAMQSNSILQRIIKDHGNARGRQFLDDATKMLLYIIRQNGMTMGLDEVHVQGKAFDAIQNILHGANVEADKLINAFYDNDTTVLKRAPGRSMRETLELRLRQGLAEARKNAEETAAYFIGDQAHSVIMTKSGARGNILNLGQMSAVVGQQAIRGERINRGYSLRTLPHFKVNDLTPKARGFVESSYRNGLKPAEFFFHAMGGREGLVDTAVRTSTSGYMQRRLVNALQDMVIENDGTVRNSDKNIIQFKFGDDGIDVMHTDHGYAVNLDVLLLKAKALDVDSIREEIKKEEKQKKSAPKKKSAAPKTKQKSSSSKKEEKTIKKVEISDEELQAQFTQETGKNAIWRGKETKAYLDWKAEKLGS
ncbi:MAG: hypothetical protein ACFE8P_13095, partial [Promethearchaeota archaeon]